MFETAAAKSKLFILKHTMTLYQPAISNYLQAFALLMEPAKTVVASFFTSVRKIEIKRSEINLGEKLLDVNKKPRFTE